MRIGSAVAMTCVIVDTVIVRVLLGITVEVLLKTERLVVLETGRVDTVVLLGKGCRKVLLASTGF